MEIYKVSLRVEMVGMGIEHYMTELTHPNEVEAIGDNFLRVTEQVVAPNEYDAYRRAYDVTEAQLRAGGVHSPLIDFESITKANG